MATLAGTVTIEAETLEEFNDLLGRAAVLPSISNLVSDEPTKVITFDLNEEI